MVNLVGYIGGDDAALVKWSDKIPDPVETATSILNMVQDLDPDWQGYPEDALAKGFRALYKLGEYEE